MTVTRRLRLALQAERDLLDISRWTVGRFGSSQARRYNHAIMAAMAELLESPTRRGVRDRADIFPGLKFYHIARRDQRGRHFILFRVLEVKGESLIEVLRVLHDSMDFERHLPTRPDENEPQG